VRMIMTAVPMIVMCMGMHGDFCVVGVPRVWILLVRLGMIVNMRVRMRMLMRVPVRM